MGEEAATGPGFDASGSDEVDDEAFAPSVEGVAVADGALEGLPSPFITPCSPRASSSNLLAALFASLCALLLALLAALPVSPPSASAALFSTLGGRANRSTPSTSIPASSVKEERLLKGGVGTPLMPPAGMKRFDDDVAV